MKPFLRYDEIRIHVAVFFIRLKAAPREALLVLSVRIVVFCRNVRTSQGTFMSRRDDPDGVIGWVEEKAAQITGLPVSHGEARHSPLPLAEADQAVHH